MALPDDDVDTGQQSPETIQQALLELAARLMHESEKIQHLAEQTLDESRRLRAAIMDRDLVRRARRRDSASSR